MNRDCLGRMRRPDQERGLRPLHPPLPGGWTSKAMRVSMSQDDWERFDSLVRAVAVEAQPPSLARAHGEAITRLMDASTEVRSPAEPLDWMDWERQKTLRLLRVRSAV